MFVHPRLHIGTSGWSYPWQGIFYPPELRPAQYLSFYAAHFNCTEINSSFYHFTIPKTIDKWLAETPGYFKFAPKLNREITHIRRLAGVNEPLERFMSRFLLMGPRLGPVLVQIPASFNFDARVAAGFFQLLRDKYPEQSFAFEARHTSWFGAEPLDLLREYNIAFVIATSGGRFPGLETATAETVYFRLHGDGKLYDSNYSDEKLEQYAFMIKEWLEDGKDIWVFFNNTLRGQALTDADKLRRLVAGLISSL